MNATGELGTVQFLTFRKKMASQISCPKCDALADRGGYQTWQWVVSICAFPIGLLSLLAGRKPNICKSCGYSWAPGSAPPRIVIEKHVSSTRDAPQAAATKDVYVELTKLDELKTKGDN